MRRVVSAILGPVEREDRSVRMDDGGTAKSVNSPRSNIKGIGAGISREG